MPFTSRNWRVICSPVLPRCWVVMLLPLRSAALSMPALASTMKWKYCGYSVATLQTLSCGLLNGGLPDMASTVEIELPKPTSALASSTPRTLAMPAPGSTCTANPGTAFSHMSLSCPPRGIHDPPCGPVMSLRSTACAGPASASARPKLRVVAFIFDFMTFPLRDEPDMAGFCCCLGDALFSILTKGTRHQWPRTRVFARLAGRLWKRERRL